MNLASKCLQYVKTKFFKFDGKTYDQVADSKRLGTQLGRVLSVMQGGEWKTLSEISFMTDDPQASVSARLRDLRKPKFGSHDIVRRNRGPKSNGLYEYKLSVKLH